MREAGDEIEEEGIRRSRASLAKAELVLRSRARRLSRCRLWT